ncbi:glycosyltransferase family 2 protein [Marivirga sp.]|uniref:glycosyltransferase family 2 protein n=1 Tax=Marivirga sp. TaxID=2018662 RepID=UPI002D7F892E|nr:glycosyltransferase family 2 protein [Marivirga sp.]HET8860556.1 glycosyltransferase family 2 protein [Marivirga sp.]
MSDFKVSVITPVYNAAKYVRKAVESATSLDEVGEVILVEDGSPDNALEICKELEREFDKVKLYQHPNGENRGAGASRNLGIEKAQFDYIAFLDADDWYLPNRFYADRTVYNEKSDLIYSSSILEESCHDLTKIYGGKVDVRKICGINATPMEIYKYIIYKKIVLFNTNGITVKRDFLIQDKLFDERLKLHQDSELWKRLLRRGNLYAGEIHKPTSVVRRHDNNRITARNSYSTFKMLAAFIENVGISNLYYFEKNYLLKSYLRVESKNASNSFLRRLLYYTKLIYYKFNSKKFFLLKLSEHLN